MSVTRTANAKDKKNLKELWKNSMPYTNSFIDWYFEHVHNFEDIIITEEDSGIKASISINPRKLKISGFEADIAYICGQAILPEMREESFFSEQLAETLAAVAQRERILSVVVPSDYRFWEKYGWRTAYSYKQYSIKPTDLPAYTVQATVERVMQMNKETASKLNDIYMDFMADKNAYAIRDERMWMMIIDDLQQNFGGRCVIFNDSQGMPIGYILYILRERRMGVYEFAYKNRLAYESIMGYIHAHYNEAEYVEIKAPINDLSHMDFCDRRDAVRYCPFAMARILDAKKVLAIVSSKLDEEFNIQVIDRFVEVNNRTFHLAGVETVETDNEADVSVDIGTLTQLFMGYINAEEANRMNLLRGNIDLLKKIFDKKSNYINMLLI